MSALKPSSLRVYTYNVLSSHLSEATHFRSCLPANLDPETRFSRCLTKLDKECSRGSVICLQEVSRTWEGRLHTFFDERKYSLVTGMYGRRFNGYMGVGIAYPREMYAMKACEVDVLADREKWPLDPRPPPPGFLRRFVRSALSLFPQRLLGSLHPSSKGPECPFELASRRSNIQVSLHLSPPTSPESSFAISTYHMPCAFRTPQMMALHSSLSVRNLQERAKEWGAGRAVLAGDFNLKPDSGLYRMITTGECPKDDKETYPLKKGVEDIGWSPRIGTGMQSCYALAHPGGEPPYTNYAQCRNDPVFIDTLDYVFISKEGWEVVGVDGVGKVEDANGPLPNDKEPSDHIAIAADLKIA